MGRRRIRVNGIVQGVGFRPFVYRLASEAQLRGFVNNDADGVFIEAEGLEKDLEVFCRRIIDESPPLANIVNCQIDNIPVANDAAFVIKESRHDITPSTLISPDVAVCEDCLSEMFDPGNRRYRYPFINCTNCGPRYTIVEGIPYDRPFTSMKVFPMCPECEREYNDPSDRRFHAQPNACPVCGPRLVLHDGNRETRTGDPITEAIKLLHEGKILAVRGVGGFHLAVDAHNAGSIERLRERKGRAQKPFALMARGMETIRKHCHVTAEEEKALRHYSRPIVILKKREGCALPENIAPRNKYLGFMLPYSPHHHLLLGESFDALIMTSGNYSEEPIAIANDEAIARLKQMADCFLLHDREILQRCDDSIMMASSGSLQIVRRARGLVPEPVFLAERIAHGRMLAVGGELKNTVALARDDQVFLSQHVGDLDNPSALAFFENSIEHLGRILEIEPSAIAYDMHPEYLSTKWALKQKLPTVGVQHHHAHLVSVMADNGISDRTVGIILDGTGYGTDGTIWGGEILVGDAARFERFAWLKPVPLPGGTAAVKQPWRMAVSHLHEAYGADLFGLKLGFMSGISEGDRQILLQMLDKGINSPLTSSCGRLFDAVSAMLGIRSEINFEAQAAIELEMSVDASDTPIDTFTPANGCLGALETSGLIRMVVESIQAGKDVGEIANQFHFSLADLLVQSADKAREKTGVNRVGLSGGVYQNRLFTKYMLQKLTDANFEVLRHRQVPTNDGGLALGQIVAAAAKLGRREA